MTEKKKLLKITGTKTVLLTVMLLIAAVMMQSLLTGCGSDQSDKKESDSDKKTVETQAATEFTVTPADEEECAAFAKNLVGVWTSYTEQGEPYTYTFNKDGSVQYKQEGKNPKEYTYTFEDGMLTVKNDKTTHVYQCSKDAVDMMARLHNGEWQNNVFLMAEKIPDFGGCVYIEDDILYMADKCMCKESSLNSFDGKSIEGDWVGVIGDTVNFAADGSYTYVKNADTFKGTYTVDFKKYTLDITINGTTNKHDKKTWGISGRVLHIGKQYYFKLS